MSIIEFRDALYGLGLAERTVNEYVKWVRRLARWGAERGYDLGELTGAEVRRWADELPYSWASRKQARTALSHYYRHRPDRPWIAIRVPRKPRPEWRGLEDPDAAALHRTALMVGGRPGLATLAGLYTAARAGEIGGLRWDGIDAAAGTLRWWRTKTSDWHKVPLHPVLADELDRQRPRAAEGHIFVGNNGRPHVSATTVWSWVRQVGDLAGVHVTPQQLRVTAGSKALEATSDLDAAAELLGHRDPAVTRSHYVRTSGRRLGAAVSALEY